MLKALERNPADRYATAQEMADDLRNYLEDRAIRARRPSLLNRCRRWSRRHKPLVLGVVVVVLTFLLLGGAALWRERQEQQGLLAALEQEIGEDLRVADLFETSDRWPESLKVLERASARLQTAGPPPLRQRVEQRRKNAAMVVRLEEARLQLAVWGESGFDYKGAAQAYASAFASYDLSLETMTAEEAAQRIRTSAIRTQLVAALDDWAYNNDKVHPGSGEPIRQVARLADDDPWREQLRNPAVLNDWAALERLAEQETILSEPPANLVLLSYALQRAKSNVAAAQLLRQAQQRNPADFWINFKLADCLSHEPATMAEALGFYRAALALRPRTPAVYNNLGLALKEQKKLPEAEAAFRKAIDLRPDLAGGPYYNLGIVLQQQKKLPEAMHAYRKAIELIPDYPEAYYNLGNALREHKKLSEAEAAYRKTIELKPDLAEAYCNLADVLKQQGRFTDALAERKRGHELGSRNPGWPYPSAQWVRQAERLVELDAKLPAILRGETKPANGTDCLTLADICTIKQLFAAAARFSQEAFADEPKLAETLGFQHRYNAACYAALAGSGKEKDADTLDAKERRARLRPARPRTGCGPT